MKCPFLFLTETQLILSLAEEEQMEKVLYGENCWHSGEVGVSMENYDERNSRRFGLISDESE